MHKCMYALVTDCPFSLSTIYTGDGHAGRHLVRPPGQGDDRVVPRDADGVEGPADGHAHHAGGPRRAKWCVRHASQPQSCMYKLMLTSQPLPIQNVNNSYVVCQTSAWSTLGSDAPSAPSATRRCRPSNSSRPTSSTTPGRSTARATASGCVRVRGVAMCGACIITTVPSSGPDYHPFITPPTRPTQRFQGALATLMAHELDRQFPFLARQGRLHMYSYGTDLGSDPRGLRPPESDKHHINTQHRRPARGQRGVLRRLRHPPSGRQLPCRERPRRSGTVRYGLRLGLMVCRV